MTTSNYARKAVLDWMLGGAAATEPTQCYAGLGSTNVPSSISPYEISALGYARQSARFGAAGTPTSSGTVTNTSAIIFTLSASQRIGGVQLWDAPTGGNCLAVGALSALSTMASLDTYSFAIGALLLKLL